MAQLKLTIMLESREGISIYKSMGVCESTSPTLNAELRRAWAEVNDRAAAMNAHATLVLAFGVREVWLVTDAHNEQGESIKFDRLIRALTRA